MRWSELIAPPAITSAPSLSAPAEADQKPMKGPNERARNTRSSDPVPAQHLWKVVAQAGELLSPDLVEGRGGRSWHSPAACPRRRGDPPPEQYRAVRACARRAVALPRRPRWP